MIYDRRPDELFRMLKTIRESVESLATGESGVLSASPLHVVPTPSEEKQISESLAASSISGEEKKAKKSKSKKGAAEEPPVPFSSQLFRLDIYIGTAAFRMMDYDVAYTYFLRAMEFFCSNPADALQSTQADQQHTLVDDIHDAMSLILEVHAGPAFYNFTMHKLFDDKKARIGSHFDRMRADKVALGLLEKFKDACAKAFGQGSVLHVGFSIQKAGFDYVESKNKVAFKQALLDIVKTMKPHLKSKDEKKGTEYYRFHGPALSLYHEHIQQCVSLSLFYCYEGTRQ